MINLVTGGAGFIGSHLVEKLMRSDDFVYCLDNFSSGNKNNIKKWLKHSNFKLINQDITKEIDIKVDKIWHLACPASPKIYQLNPIKTAKTNVLGTLNMLELAKNKDAKIILASTSEVYGNPEYHPQTEDYWGYVNPIGIKSCYKESKRFSETLCFDYLRIYKTKIKIARIFNTYGPNMMPNDGRVISNFICQALNNQSIYINGDGLQTRAFCYIDDLVDGLIKLMDSNLSGPINLGNPSQELSIKKLAELVSKKLKTVMKIKYAPIAEDDPIRRKPSISRAKTLLNWEPITDINEGLNKTINYFQGII